MNIDKMITKQKVENNSIVRERLITQKDVVFTCGIKDVLGRIKEFKVHCSGIHHSSNLEGYAISENSTFGKMMNVKKFGPTCITLYTFDMLGNKTTGKIRYSDIKFVSENTLEPIQYECENPLKKLPGFVGTEKG